MLKGLLPPLHNFAGVETVVVAMFVKKIVFANLFAVVETVDKNSKKIPLFQLFLFYTLY